MNNFCEWIRIPSEVIDNSIKVTIVGKKSVCLENYGRLTLYTNDEICLKKNEYTVRIKGSNLNIDIIDKNYISIIGDFLCISYEN